MDNKTIMFTEPNYCSGCKIMHRMIVDENIDVMILDVNTSEGAQQATKYRINGGLPAFIKTDEDENVIDSWSGTMMKDQLIKFIG